jgi:iron complex outermembrane recepter protein
MKIRNHIAVSSALALALAAPAYAQDAAAEDEGGIADIVVTAQFRNQNLQDTPLAITAIDSALLEARGQTNVADVAAQAPNVTLAAQGQQNGSGLIAFIRGVGQTDFNFALEPGVGMYVDDVYIPTLTGSLLDLMDLDRVEVLRGPQGTLAGRNSIGGAIKLFSVKPKGDGSGSMQATYGSYGRVDVRGVADFSIVPDKLSARVSGAAKSRNGYVKRLDYALTHPGFDIPTQSIGGNKVLGTLGGQSYVAGRLALRWTPNDAVEVNIAGDYSRERSEAGASVLLYANRSGTNANGQPWLPNSTGGVIPYNCRFVPNGVNSCDNLTGFNRRYVTYSTFLDRTPATTQAPFKPFSLDPHQDLDNYGIYATFDVELSDILSLKTVSAWRQYVSDWSQDVDGSPLANQQLNQTLKNQQFSNEVRLNGKVLDEKLDFTVGGIWFKRDGTLTARVDLNYAGIDFIHGPDPTPASSKALFGNFTFKVSDAFNITAGLRNTWDKKSYVFFRRNPDLTVPGPGPCAFFLGALTAGPTGIGNAPNCLLLGLNNVSPPDFKDNKFDWRVAADYRISPALMVYAQVATGYRSGGFNPRPFFGPSAGARNQIKSFNPETLTAYEVGFKTDLLDRRLRLNASGFYNDYKDIILTLSACPTAPCLQPNNVGAAKVKGFEVEATIKPADGLTFDGAFSYLDFQYKSFSQPAAILGGITLDMITPYTPKTKWSVGAQYDMENVFGGTLSTRFDGSFQGSVFTEALNYDKVVVSTTSPVTSTPTVAGITAPPGGGPLATVVASNKINSYFLGNGRLTWKSADKDWSISLEVQNILNKYYFTSLYEQFAGPASISGAPGLPRTWAMTLKRSF